MPQLEPTLRSLVVKLTAQEAGVLPGSVGELANAAFYAAIQAVDPDLSARMHDVQQRKAFSLSPLYGYRQSPQDRRIRVGAGQEGWLRICLLDDETFGAFMRHLMESSRPAIRLGAVRFAITEVLGSPASHPWAGYTSLRALAQNQPAQSRWTLCFESPTAFHWGDSDKGTRRVEVFPMPRMLINGLRKRWDEWTGEAWGKDFEDWVERNAVVSRVWSWETQPFPYRKQSYVGGVGKLEYRLLDDQRPDHTSHLDRLLRLAFYTGVGYKTTHGLGQMRLLE